MMISEDNEDIVLLKLVQKSDQEAFRIIYNRYHELLYLLAIRYLKSTMMADDVVQHTFTKFWEQRKLLLININLRNYLYTMAKNYILNQIRNNKNAIIHNYQIVQNTGFQEDNLFERIEQDELRDIFYHAIEQLPEKKKTVCMYKLRGNLSNQDIADNMQISVTTVKTHYAESIKLLKKYMNHMRFLFTLTIVLNSYTSNWF